MGRTHFSGPVVETGAENSQAAARSTVRSSSVFFPSNLFSYITGTWTFTRVGVGQYANVHTNVDETSTIILPSITLGMLVVSNDADTQRLERARGARIVSVETVYQNLATGGSLLDALDLTVQTLVHADAVALPAAVARPVTDAFILATSDTLVRRILSTVTTPFVLDETMQMSIEISHDASATSDSRFYGCYVNYDVLL